MRRVSGAAVPYSMLAVPAVAALPRLDPEVRTARPAVLAELAVKRFARAAVVRLEELSG